MEWNTFKIFFLAFYWFQIQSTAILLRIKFLEFCYLGLKISVLNIALIAKVLSQNKYKNMHLARFTVWAKVYQSLIKMGFNVKRIPGISG